jgi:hypothetical protein
MSVDSAGMIKGYGRFHAACFFAFFDRAFSS